MSIIAWNKELDATISPERLPMDGEWSQVIDGNSVKYDYYISPLLSWDVTLDIAVNPERLPTDGEWARFYSNGVTTKKQYNEPLAPPPEIIKYMTANEQVTINENPAEGLKSIYHGVPGNTVNIVVDLVDSDGNLQTQLDQASLDYPSMLSLPVVKTANANNDNVIDEINFMTSIVAGVMTAQGVFPSSGNWNLLSSRINTSLDDIDADWHLDLSDITFKICC